MPSRRTSKQRIQAIRSRPHKARKPRPDTHGDRQPSEPKDTADHTQQDLTPTAQAQSNLVPYNPRLLSRSRLQLQLGDWEKLADLDDHELKCNPAAAELQLLAAAGHLQKGGEQAGSRARALIDSAMEAGLNRESVARILIGGASNTLGRIAALSDRPDDKVMHHFRSAITIAIPDADLDTLLQPLATRQLMYLAGVTGSSSLKEMAQQSALRMGFSKGEMSRTRSLNKQAPHINDSLEPCKTYVIELMGCPGVGKTTILDLARGHKRLPCWGPEEFAAFRKQMAISPQDVQQEYDGLGLESFYQAAMSEISASDMRSLQKTMAYKMLDAACREHCMLHIVTRKRRFFLVHDELLLHKSFPIISHSRNKTHSAQNYFSQAPVPDCAIIMQDDPEKIADRAMNRGREISSLSGLNHRQIVELFESWSEVYDLAEKILPARGVDVQRFTVSESLGETVERFQKLLSTKLDHCFDWKG